MSVACGHPVGARAVLLFEFPALGLIKVVVTWLVTLPTLALPFGSSAVMAVHGLSALEWGHSSGFYDSTTGSELSQATR